MERSKYLEMRRCKVGTPLAYLGRQGKENVMKLNLNSRVRNVFCCIFGILGAVIFLAAGPIAENSVLATKIGFGPALTMVFLLGAVTMIGALKFWKIEPGISGGEGASFPRVKRLTLTHQ